MPRFATRGLRGSIFEELLELTHAQYLKAGLALMQKIPTPITPTQVNNRERTITQAYFERRGTVDFIGVAAGRALCFDAKQTATNSFPLKNIHQHQVDFMTAFEQMGGVAFILLNFSQLQRTFVVRLATLTQHMAAAHSGGRKSIPIDALALSLEVFAHPGFPVHYLPVALGL